ncbi:YqzH family protein [Cytobacillus sp. FJAT-54145]|uniref:YqzH family protein n=1 Tax=Cytobacillus spartinae TaxID=3299023 RepID=A0ABW6KH50_9BACI
MEKKLVYKMVQNCFKQYKHEHDGIPLSEKDYEDLYERIVLVKENEKDTPLNDIINDVVYEFLAGQ